MTIAPAELGVVLSDLECVMAEAAAIWFTDRVFDKKLGPGHGEVGRNYAVRLQHGTIGNYAEMAFAKYRGVYWSGGRDEFGRSRQADVDGYQVRSTTTHNGHCIVFPVDQQPVALVVVQRAESHCACQVVGWIAPDQARTPENRTRALERCHKGSPVQWWVQQSDLRAFA